MMENTLVFLLLLCSFSSAQDVFRRMSKEESDPYDIQAVLQDMSAALAEYREKIEQLQTLTQEQAAKLKELENQTSEVVSLKAKLQGYFTAPVSGAYHFEFYIGSLGSSLYSSAVLVKNGVYIFSAYEQQSSGFKTAANGVILYLRPGDVVHLRLIKNTIIYDSKAHLSTFSGHLLFPM